MRLDIALSRVIQHPQIFVNADLSDEFTLRATVSSKTIHLTADSISRKYSIARFSGPVSCWVELISKVQCCLFYVPKHMWTRPLPLGSVAAHHVKGARRRTRIAHVASHITSAEAPGVVRRSFRRLPNSCPLSHFCVLTSPTLLLPIYCDSNDVSPSVQWSNNLTISV